MRRTMLTAAQKELVIGAVARLPKSDRESVLVALWARLPLRRVEDEQLIAALNEAISQETSNVFDSEGMIPRIRQGMSLHECADLYQRTLDAPATPLTPQQEVAIRTQYSEKKLAELYARSIAETDAKIEAQAIVAAARR